MPKLERQFVLCILFYIVVNSLFQQFERMFFWGEFFVILTTFLILKIPYTPKKYQTELLIIVLTWVFLFPLYGLWVSTTFWPQVLEPFYLFRHAVFFYYCVFFFFAFKYAHLILFYLKKYTTLLMVMVPFAAVTQQTNTVSFPPLIGLMLMGAAQREERSFFSHRALPIAFASLLFFTGAGTNKFILALYLGYFGLNFIARFWTRIMPSQINRILLIIFFGLGITLCIRFLSGFHELTSQMALLGDSIATLETISKEHYTDLSGYWRLVLWSHLYGRFMEHPWGLGIGTPLFADWLDGFVMLNLWKPGENYIQGAHNSFITFIARFGIPGLILFSFMFYYVVRLSLNVFRKFGFQPFKTKESRLLSGAFLAFVSMCITVSFNVALESPLHAGTFWFSFGLFTRLFGDFLTGTPEMNLLDEPHELHLLKQIK